MHGLGVQQPNPQLGTTSLQRNYHKGLLGGFFSIT